MIVHRLCLISLALLAFRAGGSAAAGESEPPQPGAPPAGKPAPPTDGEEPKVLTAEQAAARLRAPGDRYDPNAVDWRKVPPWRQASFYGIRVQGQVIVYVVDCSGSMVDDARLARAKAELRRSVLGLQFPQRFKVIFYNDQPLPMPGDAPRSADVRGKSGFLRWLDTIQPLGETDPRSSLSLAMALKPDAIFLLSDGEFPDGTAEAVAGRNRAKVPIHCIDLSGGTGGDHLRRIADESGGRYVLRP